MPELPLIEPETATGETRNLLDSAQQTFGITPNMVKAMANSPPALAAFLALANALRDGAIPAATRSRLALLVAQENRCDYCLSVHSYVARGLTGLTRHDTTKARFGEATDPTAAAMLELATALVRRRGAITDAEFAAASATLTPAEFVEVIAHVALDTFGNYLTLAGRVDIDWPLVRHTDEKE